MFYFIWIMALNRLLYKAGRSELNKWMLFISCVLVVWWKGEKVHLWNGREKFFFRSNCYLNIYFIHITLNLWTMKVRELLGKTTWWKMLRKYFQWHSTQSLKFFSTQLCGTNAFYLNEFHWKLIYPFKLLLSRKWNLLHHNSILLLMAMYQIERICQFSFERRLEIYFRKFLYPISFLSAHISIFSSLQRRSWNF